MKIIFVLFFIIYNFSNKLNALENNNYKGKIIFSTSPRMYPFEFYDQNRDISGFDIDFIKLVFKFLNKEIEVIDNNILQSFQLLKINQIDGIISTIIITESRLKSNFFNLSDPYFEDDLVLLHKKNKNFNNLIDFDGLNISCTYGCFMFKEWFEKNLPNTDKKKWLFNENPANDIKFLMNEKFDAILINKNEAKFLKEKFSELEIFDKFILNVQYTILLNKENKKLLNEINIAIKALEKSDLIEELKKKYSLN